MSFFKEIEGKAMIRACQMRTAGVVRRIRRPKVDRGQSISFSAVYYSLQALEPRAGDSILQCHFDQWLIDGGMGVLGPVACVHCPSVKNSGFSQPSVPCSLAAFLERTACTKIDGSPALLLIQVIVHSPQQKPSNQM